ncbi:MAG: NADH-quinone oxidoreductase subunit L [Planctomycetes bacterium]|nr:NADH-quinone oxidoreductase subunit L [Planctomycetota bacterium]
MLLEGIGELFRDPQTALTYIPLMPLLGFIINGFFGKKLSPTLSGVIATAAIGMSFILALVVVSATFIDAGPSAHAGVESGVATVSHSFSWITGMSSNFSIDFGLRVDALGAIMVLVITGVGSLIHIYSIGYMSHDKSYWRYFAYLNLFCFAMLCLALGDNMVLLFLGWEGVGLCSYLLIGFWYTDVEKSKAGKKAFIANRVGDLGFLIGMFLIAWHFGSVEFTTITTEAKALAANGSADTSLMNWAMFFLFIGATGKSAQIPLYVWLPDAMAGPTPVSALIHAATMVTAGVYMCARMGHVLELATWVPVMISVVGGLTALMAASIGLVQRDIKKVLAYSTVSQLGFMFMAIGVGAYWVAIFHVVTHAFFKALLFLGSGSVIHSLEHGYGHGNPDSQDMRLMGGLIKKMPFTGATMVIGGIALAGIPPLAGFFSKDEILLALQTTHRDAANIYFIVYILGALAALMTAFYTARLLALTFFGEFRGDKRIWDKVHESSAVMYLPLCVLAGLAVVAGFTNIPHNLGHDLNHFYGFLKSVFPLSEHARSMTDAEKAALTSAEWRNQILSTIIAVLSFVAGFAIYKKAGALEKAEKRIQGGLKPVFNTLLNKYYVDELYEKVIIKPIKLLANLLYVFVDVIVIDVCLVMGPAFVVGAFGHVFRRVQTGLVSAYLYLFAAGAAAILFYFIAS